MRITEILSEAQMSPEIKKIMTSKGYKYINHGQDQDVYFAPDGTILKIFGWDKDKGGSGFTRAQDSFITFANYCRQHESNPFLPDFSDWAPFEHKGKTYLQIKCERLFPLDGKWDEFGDELEVIVDGYLDQTANPQAAIDQYLEDEADNPMSHQLVMMLGKEGLTQFATTVSDLSKLAAKHNFGLDLHGGNFMFGSDGHIVINDPFFTGSFRNW